ncbi:MAG: succinate dehydrogenase cytochrome b subunit [Acidobacteriota bacterium]
MSWILDLYRSPMAKKVVMAVTGLMLFGFVLAHMVGNLKIYQGAEKLDAYAVGLRELGAPVLGYGEALWLMRGGLVAAVVLHILSAYQLTMVNRRARASAYKKTRHRESTYASRTMRWGGVIIVLFVVYHLLHFTTGHAHPEFEHGKVFNNVVLGFQNPLSASFYILANLALGLHLFHGLWSMFQTLGWNGPRFNPARKAFAVAFALLIAGINISFPVAVLAGVVKPEAATVALEAPADEHAATATGQQTSDH